MGGLFQLVPSSLTLSPACNLKPSASLDSPFFDWHVRLLREQLGRRTLVWPRYLCRLHSCSLPSLSKELRSLP
jgi:hypothetical protein